MMIRKRILAAGIISLLCALQSSASGENQFQRFKVSLPPVTEVKLDNGLRIFYIGDDLPQLTISANVGFGKLHEKQDTAGISEVLAKMLLLSGSKKYPGNDVHRKIDSLGGDLSIASSWEHTTITIRVLAKFYREAFDIMADLVANPNFEGTYLDTAKALVIDKIKRSYDDPATIAFDKAREIIFDGNGYGSIPTEEKIKTYSIDLIRHTWDRYYRAGNILMGISTSIGPAEIRDLSREYFSSFQPGEERAYEVDTAAIEKKIKDNSGRIFLYIKDIPQSTIVVGTVAPRIGERGNYALEVMNYILGGGSFNSRLMKEIRVKRGYAYAVQSIIRARSRTGLFIAYAQTENSTAGEVMKLVLDNIELMARQKVDDSEIKWARNSISNSFIFGFDTPLNILGNYMDAVYNRLPADYYERYLINIEEVQDEDILRESRDLLNSGLIRVVVGGKTVADRLKAIGDVVIINGEQEDGSPHVP